MLLILDEGRPCEDLNSFVRPLCFCRRKWDDSMWFIEVLPGLVEKEIIIEGGGMNSPFFEQ